MQFGIIIIFKIISTPIAYVIVRIFNLNKPKKQIRQNWLYKPLRSFFALLGLYIGFIVLKLPGNTYDVIDTIFRICVIVLVADALVNLLGSASTVYGKVTEKLNVKASGTMVTLIGKIMKILIIIVAGFIIIKELGYDLSGLVAGLGISSVIIALAAQDLVKSLLAGFTILTDKPFEIGDMIETSTFTGTVEDISFRVTRLRDLNNQIVVIPNSNIINSYVINLSSKEKRRYNLKLTLELGTSMEKVNSLVEKLRLTFVDHPSVLNDSIRVAFDDISINGIDIIINFYTEITDLQEYTKFKEGVNYKILDIIQKEDLYLAYPSQNLYVKHKD